MASRTNKFVQNLTDTELEELDDLTVMKMADKKPIYLFSKRAK